MNGLTVYLQERINDLLALLERITEALERIADQGDEALHHDDQDD
jgi:hypothetical protein